MRITVAQYLVAQLKAWGIKRIYGVVGSEIIPLLNEIEKDEKLQFIAVRHESAAGFMASTEAKITGKLGVCISTSGPGLANLLNGVADAAFDHVPVLVLSGQIATKHIGTHYKQYLNQQQFISPLALYSEMIAHPEASSPLLIQAMQAALFQRGVAHLSIPVDIQEMTIEKGNFIAPYPLELLDSEWTLKDSQIEEAVEKIKASQRPAILIGRGAKAAVSSIQSLAEKTGAFLIASLGAKGFISEEHPQHLGGIGDGGSSEAIDMLQEADLLLMIGCTWFPAEYIPKQLPIIQIEINPAHTGLHHHLLAALIGKAEQILPKLIELLPAEMNPDWRRKVFEAHQRYIKRLEQESMVLPTQSPIHPIHLIGELEKTIPEKSIVILDTGEHTILFNRYFKGMNQDILFSGKWRSMGYALPSANVSQLLFPERKVIAVIGDGSLLMNVGELSTSIRHKLPIKVIVMNNQSLLLEERKSWSKGYRPSGTDLTNPDLVSLAKSFGWRGMKANKEGDLSLVLQSAFQSNEPVLIDVHLNHALLTNLKP